ncbi:multifunctional triterpene synthase [Salix suchowensis]|nr:multifunctional triterpene synthase [Salix suchowensis]
MWRLKIAEGGIDPNIHSTNNFLGRQTWEFDPDAGTLEERAEIEEARQNFWKNRNVVKPSSDLLWRFQGEKFKQTIPQVKIEDGEEISYEKATSALRRSVHLLTALQASDGHWCAENSGPMFYFPPLNEDGGWGLHIEGHSTMFCTVLNYICMRMLGEGRDGGRDKACERARKWILDHGSAIAISSWGKTWLAIIGVYEWAGCNPMPPEFWFLPSTSPIHPGNLLCYCRLTYLPMAYLYGKKFVGPITPLILQIREEIYNEPYEKLNWRSVRHLCAKPLYMLACWVEDPNGAYFRRHLARIMDYVWIGEDGIKMQVTENPPGDFRRMFRHISKGSWTFSDKDHGWQVSDCTAESMKSKNGGVSAWEPAGAGLWLEWLNPVEFLEIL